jgi:hypothetical protein
MRIEPEVGSCSIVLLGHFNPLILAPLWFARNGLITQAEADEADVSVMHPEIVVVKIGKIQIQVEANRFTADTAESPWVDVADFVGRTFGEFLIHTPINQMGINLAVHFSVGDEATRNKIGRILAPLAPWGEWGKEMNEMDAKDGIRAGSTNVTMLQPKLKDGDPKSKEGEFTGHLQATVQPSTVVKANTGIFVLVNDHHSSGPLEKTVGCEHMMARLNKKFEESIRKSESIIDQIMSLKDQK